LSAALTAASSCLNCDSCCVGVTCSMVSTKLPSGFGPTEPPRACASACRSNHNVWGGRRQL
jgi:hypothetical protein